jgi:hypothetical protein
VDLKTFVAYEFWASGTMEPWTINLLVYQIKSQENIPFSKGIGLPG